MSDEPRKMMLVRKTNQLSHEKTIVINIPITVSFDTEVEVAGKVFKALLEKELFERDLQNELAATLEKAKGRAIEHVNDLTRGPTN